jgi:aerobic-type carbon monoxide dehydrogenase small subunit (CoxS/CutS family)
MFIRGRRLPVPNVVLHPLAHPRPCAPLLSGNRTSTRHGAPFLGGVIHLRRNLLNYSSAFDISIDSGGGQHMFEPIQLDVNGKRIEVASHPGTSLLYVLREVLGLTGSKYGCGEGQCGACTVLFGGTPRRSCQLAVADAIGKPILTIESLEENGKLHPVQQAFLDAGAFQCAYCTSGMIMSSVALLQRNSNPDASEIVQSLQGNICRCGTHPRILAAVQQAAKAMQGRVR